MLKKNRLLCVDVLTYLQHDAYPEEGKLYAGTLRNLPSKHGLCGNELVFCESIEKKVIKTRRNPVIFAGGCINVHKMADGEPRMAFNHPRFYPDFTFRDFCLAAIQELSTIVRLFGDEITEE